MEKVPENRPQSQNYPLRHPCKCGSNLGRLSRKGPHIQVNCKECGEYAFFAPFRDLIAKGIHPDMIGSELVGLEEPQPASTFDLKKKEVP